MTTEPFVPILAIAWYPSVSRVLYIIVDTFTLKNNIFYVFNESTKIVALFLKWLLMYTYIVHLHVCTAITCVVRYHITKHPLYDVFKGYYRNLLFVIYWYSHNFHHICKNKSILNILNMNILACAEVPFELYVSSKYASWRVHNKIRETSP
jgi:hypothetical protein